MLEGKGQDQIKNSRCKKPFQEFTTGIMEMAGHGTQRFHAGMDYIFIRFRRRACYGDLIHVYYRRQNTILVVHSLRLRTL